MCEIVDEYHNFSIQKKLSDDVINYIRKKGIKVGTVREFLTHLKTKGSHFDSFIKLLNDETKILTCEFLGRFNKIPPSFTYELIFNKSNFQSIPSEILYKRIIFILSSDVDLLIANLQSRNKHKEIHTLIGIVHEMFEYATSRDIQPFFDALKKDVISKLLNHNPELFIGPYLDQLKILVIRSYLGSSEIRLFGKTAMSESSFYIYKFLDSHKSILDQRRNSTLLIETFAHYFHSKEYNSQVSCLVAKVPKLVRNIVLQSYLNSKEIELLIHEITTYLRIMDIHQNFCQVEKVLQLAHSYKMISTNNTIGKLLWTMITDIFLICDSKDIDWLYARFNNSITKNFFRKMIQHPEDRIYALTNLLKFYYLFTPACTYWKCKTNEEFYSWLFSESQSEKLELILDICGLLSTKIQSTYLIGLFIYLALHQKRIYRILLGHCNVYGLQTLNRNIYLNELYHSLYPLIEALRNIATKLVIKANQHIDLKEELIQNLLASGWKMNFEDQVYESLCKIKNPELLEAYCIHINKTIQDQDYFISKRNCRFDFYKIQFSEVKSSLKKIINKLLGPLPIICAKNPRSEICHIQMPDFIDYYYDSKDPFEQNRNVLHYKGLIVKEATKYLSSSEFLLPEDFEETHRYPTIYFKIYEVLEDWRCQNIFIKKYSSHYATEIKYLSIYNNQNVEQFTLSKIISKDLIGLLSIYCAFGLFPKHLMMRPEVRKFLYTPISSTKQTAAEWIQFHYDNLMKRDTVNISNVSDIAISLYQTVIGLDHKNWIHSDAESYESEDGYGNQNPQSIEGSKEGLQEAYNDFYKFLTNHKDPLHEVLDQLHQECKYDIHNNKLPTTNITNIIDHKYTNFSPWDCLHNLIDNYKT